MLPVLLMDFPFIHFMKSLHNIGEPILYGTVFNICLRSRDVNYSGWYLCINNIYIQKHLTSLMQRWKISVNTSSLEEWQPRPHLTIRYLCESETFKQINKIQALRLRQYTISYGNIYNDEITAFARQYTVLPHGKSTKRNIK